MKMPRSFGFAVLAWTASESAPHHRSRPLGGEEQGLIGSSAYAEDHPEVV